jgi:YidC/Oxa1 family membrane protein insertase
MFLANVLMPLISVEQWTLKALHSIGLGWGLAIVGLTIMVRLSTLPLVVKQFRAQRELRTHMPQMRALQQRYKDDKQRLQQEMQAYYREHGINPLAAFAPLLIQIPVFISLYYLMRHDVKNGLFGDSGLLFIPHLTQKPHGAVLVALVLTYLTSQLTSSLIATRAMQGGQRGLMLALPLLFVGIVARFPAGLAVYWITTSLWTLGQQFTFWRLGAGALPELGGGAALATAGGPAPDALPAPKEPARGATASKAAVATKPAQGTAQGTRKRSSRKRKHGRRR